MGTLLHLWLAGTVSFGSSCVVWDDYARRIACVQTVDVSWYIR